MRYQMLYRALSHLKEITTSKHLKETTSNFFCSIGGPGFTGSTYLLSLHGCPPDMPTAPPPGIGSTTWEGVLPSAVGQVYLPAHPEACRPHPQGGAVGGAVGWRRSRVCWRRGRGNRNLLTEGSSGFRWLTT